MKIFYAVLFMAFTFYVAAQEVATASPPPNAQPLTFKLYPNPSFNGAVYITTDNNQTKDIIVYDVFGTIVLRDRITTTYLNISKLSPGIYVLQVTEAQKVMTRKLVVQ